MKIFMLINSLEVGGGERVMLDLAQHLEKDNQVSLFVLKDVVEYKSKVKVTALSSNPKLPLEVPLLASKFKQMIKEQEPDVVLSFLELSNFVNILACKGTKAKAVISVRSVLTQVYNKGLYGKFFTYMIKKLYPQAHLIITNSKYSALSLSTHYAIPATNIISIYNPLNVMSIKQLSKEPLSPVHAKIFRSDVIIHVGRLIPVKNQERIIRIFARARTGSQKLVIIGDGPLRKHLDKIVENLGMKDSIFLLGNQSNPFKFMARSKLFIMASDYEGFPNALAEAMACGVTVISTDCKSGPREILAPKTDIIREAKKPLLATYGVLVPPLRRRESERVLELTITKLLSDRALLRKYSKMALERAKEFDTSRIAGQFLEAFNVKR